MVPCKEKNVPQIVVESIMICKVVSLSATRNGEVSLDFINKQAEELAQGPCLDVDDLLTLLLTSRSSTSA